MSAADELSAAVQDLVLDHQIVPCGPDPALPTGRWTARSDSEPGRAARAAGTRFESAVAG